jgi:hypothetical protein
MMTVIYNIRTVANDSGFCWGLILKTKFLTCTTIHIF